MYKQLVLSNMVATSHMGYLNSNQLESNQFSFLFALDTFPALSNHMRHWLESSVCRGPQPPGANA